MKKITKNLLIFSLILGGLFLSNWVFAQGLGLNAVSNGLGGSLTATDPRVLAGKIINIVLGFLGVVAIGIISYAGFIWMTSNGDAEKVDKAKNILKDGIIGLVIILASWGIATFILSRLGGAINPGSGNNNPITCVGSSCSFPPPCVGPSCNNNGGGGGGNSDCASSSSPNCQASNGHPVIQRVSPIGNFCTNNINKSCSSNNDCPGSTCNLNTPNGAVNNFITISGQNFGTYSATSSKIVFEGQGKPVFGQQTNNLNPSCINSWTNKQIIIAVPAGASSGPIKIINKAKLSDLSNDSYGPKIPDFQVNTIVRPGLCELSPNSGKLSAVIRYSGVNLHSGLAYFGNYKNNIPALQSSFSSSAGLSGTSIIPNIVPGVSSSFVQTNINGSLERSNYLSFTKKVEAGYGPFIFSFNPTSGNSGQYVTIRGDGFGAVRGDSQVYFGNTEASYDFPIVCLHSVWSNNRIIVKVPNGLNNGAQMITIKLAKTTISTKKLNPNIFQFDKALKLKTSLCKIQPASGPAGTPISLWGEYFGTIQSSGLVKFNYNINTLGNVTGNATGTIQQDGQADLIKTTVPVGAITGPVKVIKNSDWGNALNFNIGSCTTNLDCGGSQICCAQNTYKQGRCVDTSEDCLTNIPTSVFEWNFSTGFNTTATSSGPIDPCTAFNSLGACQADSHCCFDALATGGAKCRSGNQITNSKNKADNGYCAYYSCSTTNSTQCASNPAKTGPYKTSASCDNLCPTKPACSSFTSLNACQADTHCCFNAKASGGAKCRSGNQIIDSANKTDDGYCAYYSCQVPPPASNSKLCATSTFSATGTYSGVDTCILGCTGNIKNNPIINPRPKIISVSPKNLATDVCRNTLIKVNFNQNMDVSSFRSNTLLLEKRDYASNQTCPSGTFAMKGNTLAEVLNQHNKNWWQDLSGRMSFTLAQLSHNLLGTALAGAPKATNLYCSIPGTVYGENNGDRTSLMFRPSKLLNPSTTYYLVVKGDQSLNNKTGVLSYKEIGFDGPGYFDGTVYIAGGLIRFNSHKYVNSQIIKFSTLSSQGPTAGICAVDHVSVTPASYLFNTTINALQSEENDSNAAPSNKTFDTIADSDKVFSATAYSVNDQILQSVPGYAWNWDFSLSSPKVATIASVANLSSDQVFVRANKGITDSETKVTATINMNKFISPSCSSNCNAYQGGNGFNNSGDIHVFICNNPWPPVNITNGTWYPWSDKSQGPNSPTYNYKFYYCRDAGGPGTLDDLPALNSNPLTLGKSATLVCSSDHSACTKVGTACGTLNSSGQQNGVCIQGILKQSYFFRAPILSSATIDKLTDRETGASIKIDWQSAANQVYAYKIYYLSPGQTAVSFKDVQANKVCTNAKGLNICSLVINGLTNNLVYIFQVSVISNDMTESALSPGLTVTPTDQTPPAVPIGLQAIIDNSLLKFSWATSTSDTVSYRLYHGILSGKYGESFNSIATATSLTFPFSQFPIGNNYFALSAFDSSSNESAKSSELSCIMSLNPAHPSSTTWSILKCN